MRASVSNVDVSGECANLAFADAPKEPLITSVPATPQSPSPRVGSASTTLRGKIYMFSGRGGIAMAPVEENGALWVYDPLVSTWSLLSPDASSPYPAARSYHCLASDGDDKIYVHAGCPEKGRLSDLWFFRVSDRTWVQLASAPNPPRGGTSITFAGGLLYRMNGFDGKVEQGGSLDIYNPTTDAWSVRSFSPNGVSGPTPRSVSALLSVNIHDRSSLVTLFGEHDPSSLGHQGAGKMASDVWVYDIDSQNWDEVKIHADNSPAARGWFAADVLREPTVDRIVVQGGLGETNERLRDLWVLDF
jgi:galactose oxidase-like protein